MKITKATVVSLIIAITGFIIFRELLGWVEGISVPFRLFLDACWIASFFEITKFITEEKEDNYESSLRKN